MHPTALIAPFVRWTSRSSIAAAFLLLGGGVALGILGTYSSAREFVLVRDHGLEGIVAAWFIVAFSLALFGTVVHLARRPRPLDPKWFLVALIAGGAIAHVILVAIVKPVWGSDYRLYWEYAQRLVEQGEYGGLTRPYYSRSLFVPYPIVRIFGPDAIFMLKLANVGVMACIQLAGYDLMRRIRGHQVAQAGSLLFLAAPIPAFTMMIPSHDLWGLLFVSAALWTATFSYDAAKRTGPAGLTVAILAAVATGALTYLAQVQRGTGLLLCAALLLTAALAFAGSRMEQAPWWRTVRSRHLAMAALFALVYCASSIADEHIKLRSDDRPKLMNIKFAANASGMGNGKSDWAARFSKRFSSGHGTPERAEDLFHSLALSSWALAPRDSGARVAKYSERLFSLTYTRDWDWLLRKPAGLSKGAREAMLFYADVYGFLFGLALLISILKTAATWRLPHPTVTASIIFVVAVALPLVLIFENKPYNVFPIWLVGALLTASQLRPVVQANTSQWWRNPAIGGSIFIALIVLLAPLAIRAIFEESNGRLLSDWTLRSKNIDVPDGWLNRMLSARPEAFDRTPLENAGMKELYLRNAPEDGARIQKYAPQNYARLEFPAPPTGNSTISLETEACIAATGRNQLEFFLYSPSISGNTDDQDFQLQVLVDNRVSEDIDIPLQGKDFRRFVVTKGLADNSCHKVAFRLRATATGNREVPFVEIWLPRLIH
ncbi:hypothetical protein [Lysobacter sp. F60174L2]|uniref:hypothetical protein n=1 Tax=Lysobacter sp. F60174L2 TaxID=3459295 RepID=UPI00403D7B70